MAARKRFYERASIAEDEQVPGRFRLLLDGKPVKTPRAQALLIPGARLAQAIVEEWQSQEGEIRLPSMPMTRHAMSLADHVMPRLEDVRAEALAYAASDLLCYRAASPAALAERQHAKWQPHLDWAKRELGAAFVVTEGVAPIPQPAEVVAALERALASLGAGEVFVAHALTHRLGSLVLALAVLRRRIDAAEAFALSRLDEIWQAERWGEDEEAAERAGRMSDELAQIARFRDLLP